MGKILPLLALAIGLASAAQAQAHGLHFDNDHCGYSTDYDIRVNADGIAFDRQGRPPASVFMHDGQLRVDGRLVVLSAADAECYLRWPGLCGKGWISAFPR